MFQSGSQINPSLGRTDYSAYTQGAAQGAQAIGQGMQQLGQGIGAAIKDYNIKKEEKELNEAARAELKKLAIANPEIAKQFNITDVNDDKQYDAGVKVYGPRGVLQLAQGVKKDQEIKDKDNRIGSLAMIISKGVEVPQDYLQNISAAEYMTANGMAQSYLSNEASLREKEALIKKTIKETKVMGAPKPINGFSFNSFQDATSALGDKFTGTIKPDPATGGVIVEGISPRAGIDQSKTNLPQGMRLNAKGEAEWIPGTPGSTEQADSIQKGQQYIQKTIETTDNILETIDEAKGYAKSGIWAIGAAAPLMNKIGGTDARALAARINTIKSSLGLDKLNEMKQASKTGASGLGGVAVAELQALQGSIAELDQAQSEKAFAQSLSKIERHYKNWRSTVTDKEYYSPSQKAKPNSGAEAMWNK